MVLHVVPVVREELPLGVDLGGQGRPAPAPARVPGGARMRLHDPLAPLRAIFHPAPTPGVLGGFGQLDAAVDTVRRLRAGGHHDFTVYSPIPRHELEDVLEQPVSPVRMFTLIGGAARAAPCAASTPSMSPYLASVPGAQPIRPRPPP